MEGIKRKRRCEMNCTEHMFSLHLNGPRPSKHQVDVVMCPKFQREPQPPQMNYPVFNNDFKFYTQAFLLGVDKRSLVMNDQQELMDHQKLVRESFEKLNQFCFPRPNSKNVNCSVCREAYRNYYEHIASNEHRIRIGLSDYNNYIKELLIPFRHLWEGAEERAYAEYSQAVAPAPGQSNEDDQFLDNGQYNERVTAKSCELLPKTQQLLPKTYEATIKSQELIKKPYAFLQQIIQQPIKIPKILQKSKKVKQCPKKSIDTHNVKSKQLAQRYIPPHSSKYIPVPRQMPDRGLTERQRSHSLRQREQSLKYSQMNKKERMQEAINKQHNAQTIDNNLQRRPYEAKAVEMYQKKPEINEDNKQTNIVIKQKQNPHKSFTNELQDRFNEHLRSQFKDFRGHQLKRPAPTPAEPVQKRVAMNTGEGVPAFDKYNTHHPYDAFDNRIAYSEIANNQSKVQRNKYNEGVSNAVHTNNANALNRNNTDKIHYETEEHFDKNRNEPEQNQILERVDSQVSGAPTEKFKKINRGQFTWQKEGNRPMPPNPSFWKTQTAKGEQKQYDNWQEKREYYRDYGRDYQSEYNRYRDSRDNRNKDTRNRDRSRDNGQRDRDNLHRDRDNVHRDTMHNMDNRERDYNPNPNHIHSGASKDVYYPQWGYPPQYYMNPMMVGERKANYASSTNININFPIPMYMPCQQSMNFNVPTYPVPPYLNYQYQYQPGQSRHKDYPKRQ